MAASLGGMIARRPHWAVRPSKAQALDILQDATVYGPWGIYVEDIQSTASLLLLDGRVLLQLIQKQDDLEIHICCKRRDRTGVRPILTSTLEWLSSCGWNEIYTTAPDDRAALRNMLSNLGFTEKNARWVYGL